MISLAEDVGRGGRDAGGDGRLLERNIAVYEALTGMLTRTAGRLSPESVLRAIENVAEFASGRHPGIFADGRLENLAGDAARRLDDRASHVARRRPGTRGVLHVTTVLPEIGGHARTLLNWIQADRSRVHTIAVTRQSSISAAFAKQIAACGGEVVPLAGSRMANAARLRALARECADLIVLHHGSEDIVPSVAFADDDLPPVCLLQHTDHLFWLGNGVADTVVNLRPISLMLNADRRGVRHDSSLPIPLIDPLAHLDRDTARVALGIPESQLMLLSVGRAQKYKPSATHNFFKSAAAMLRRHPHAHFYVVGITEAEARRLDPAATHPRLHLLGPRPDASAYQVAADIYIESFPFGSQTACLEACLCGVPPVLAYSPASPLLATNDTCLDGFAGTPATEADHAEVVARLVERSAVRRGLGSQLRRRLLAHHAGDAWLGELHRFYEGAERLRHAAVDIPARACRRDPVDVVLANWLEAQARRPRGYDPQPLLKRWVLDIAHIVRESGSHVDAARWLNASRQPLGITVETALMAAKLAPHWVVAYARGLRPGSDAMAGGQPSREAVI